MLLFLVCLGFDIFVYYSFFKHIREERAFREQQNQFQDNMRECIHCLCFNVQNFYELSKENKKLKQQIKNLEKEKVIEHGNI